MGDMRDALVKAGLASTEAVRREGRGGPRRSTEDRRGKETGRNGPSPGDALPHAADLGEIIRRGEVSVPPGRHRFHYVDRTGRIPFLEVGEETVQGLVDGSLAIAETPATGAVVITARTAERAVERDAEAVRFWNRS